MSLVNFSLPYQITAPSPFVYNGVHHTVNNLRLNAVLPPTPLPNYNTQNEPYSPTKYLPLQDNRNQHRVQNTRYTNYNRDFRRTQPRHEEHQNQIHLQQHQSWPVHATPSPPHLFHSPPPPPPLPSPTLDQSRQEDHQDRKDLKNVQVHDDYLETPSKIPDSDGYPEQPNGYTRVSGTGGPEAKTSVHAILDYDDDFDDYYEHEEQNVPRDAQVTPIQGPIFLKNGSVPVVPLYSYPSLNNGTFVQIPILWTALSVALGVELRGDLVRGAPCIKKYHQLFCPTAGNTYPIERIAHFIDENKALMKRMYGDFEMNPSPAEPGHRTTRKKRSSHDLPDGGPNISSDNSYSNVEGIGDTYFGEMKSRTPRQSFEKTRTSETGRIDVCESKVEIVTPYWASNSAGKVRAIVNTQHFEQAIHQEVCSKTQTTRCKNDCGCEQKYKWHRLLAYDPDNDCKGIFMDWFLFPSCCVCRCDPPMGNKKSTPGSNGHN